MTPASPFSGQVEIFCSYAHEDEGLRKQFEESVAVELHEGRWTIWHDRRIEAGSEWPAEIDQHLNSAHIITLLVSRSFLASKYCYGIEVKRAMERHATKEALVVPIIVRSCHWERAPFGSLQALPSDARPVESWPNHDEAWTDVSKMLERAVLKAFEDIQGTLQAQFDASANLSKIAETLNERGRTEAEEATLRAQMDAGRQQAQMERWRVLQDTQAKILEIQQSLVTGPRAKQAATYRKWEEYIRS